MSKCLWILSSLANLDGFSMVPGPNHPAARSANEYDALERYLAEIANGVGDPVYVEFLRVCAEFYLQDALNDNGALRRDGTVLTFSPLIDEAMKPDLAQSKFPFCDFGFASDRSIDNSDIVDAYFAESKSGPAYDGVWVQRHFGSDQTTWSYFCDSFETWLNLLLECDGDLRHLLSHSAHPQ